MERDGEVLSPGIWKNAKTQALLKILAGERGRVFSADELIEYLWDELDLRSAASNLRSRVAELRKILEPSLRCGERSRYIRTERGGYVLCAESDCWIDTEEFSLLEERGRRAHREGNFDEAIASFERALALYRGEYLAEDRYEEWAMHPRERWRERFVEVLSLLADSLARRGQYQAALGYLERAVAEAPLHETLYRQMMLYAFCAGDRARACHAYERCRAVLERELGERPSSQTEEIFRQVQAEEIPGVERIYPKALIAIVPMKIRRPPFVGRTREWEQLTLALAKARSGAGRVVLIFGEAGVGKTRLGEEFLRWAREHTGAQTLYGRCYELENPLSLYLWIEALREGILRLNRDDLGDVQPAWLAELSEIMPELQRVIPDVSHRPLPPEHRQYRLFETLFSILTALALRHAPLLVFVDDLQWADASSLDFLCSLIERIANHPVLILGAVRSEELRPGHGIERVRHQGARSSRLDEIHLAGLSEQEIEDLVRSLADEFETTADFGGRLYRESVGNPLFVTTVLQALFENGAFVQEGSRWRLTDPSRIALVPSAVHLLERRVKRVSTAAQRVLHLVACAVQIELEVLEAAWEGDSEELFAHLGELTSQGMLIERGGQYEFAHDKFREVVYRQLEEPQRIWLHRRIAQALEKTYRATSDVAILKQLAYHSERGHQLPQALQWLLQAVQEHKQNYQLNEGLATVAKGLGLLKEMANKLTEQERLTQEFELIAARVEFHLHLGRFSEIASDLETLVSLSTYLRDVRRQARVHLLKAQVSEDQGRPEEALAAAEQALQFYSSSNDLGGQASSLLRMSRAHYWLENYHEAVEYAQRAYQLAEKLHDNELLVKALNVLGSAYSEMGDYPSALKYLDQALHIPSKDRRIRSDLLNDLGAIYWQQGDLYQAMLVFQDALAIVREIGDRFGTGIILSSLGNVLIWLGQYARASQALEEAYTIFAAMNEPSECARVQRGLGRSYSAQGDHHRAIAVLEDSLKTCSDMDDAIGRAESLRTLSEVYLASGHLAESLTCLQEALHTKHAAGNALFAARCQLVLARIYQRQGKPDQALQACEEALQKLATLQAPHIALEAHYCYSQILQALDQAPKARESLQTAHKLLLHLASRITDDSLRESFLAIPLHHEILSQSPS